MITETMLLVFQSLCTVVQNLFIFLFLSKVYGCKYERKILYALSFVLTSVLFIVYNRIVEIIGIPLLNFLYGFIYIHILCWLLFKRDYKKTFMYNSLFIITLMFSDILTVACLSLIKGENFISVASHPDNAIVTYVVYIFMMLFIWFVFVTALTKNNILEIRLKQILLLGLFTIFETFVVDSYAQEVEQNLFNIKIIIIMMGFLMLNIYLVYFVEEITKSYKAKYKYILMKNQSQVQLEHYIEISKKYEESRKMLHDVKKHLSTLDILKFSDKERAEEYSSLVERKIDSIFTGFQCSNNILCIIMSQKIAVAENEMINVNTQVEDINFDFIDDLDITAIFANLWDNAIEANIKVNCEDRYIKVIIGRVNDFIVISFENKYNGITNCKSGKIISTKAKHDGMGISIIKSSLQKYNGTFSISFDQEVFKTEILIPIQ